MFEDACEYIKLREGLADGTALHFSQLATSDPVSDAFLHWDVGVWKAANAQSANVQSDEAARTWTKPQVADGSTPLPPEPSSAFLLEGSDQVVPAANE